MNIVVLDGACLNPGDLDWSEFEQFGSLKVYEHTESDKHSILKNCPKNTSVVITNKVILNEAIFSELPNLKLIAVAATGVNSVDIGAARKRKIAVCNIPSYGTASVAQHTFALILELMNHVGLHNQSVQKGEWSEGWKWSYFSKPMTELQGKTLGIIGFGNIGKQVAKIAEAFEMEILVNKRSDGGGQTHAYQFVEKEYLYKHSDIISLHCPLTSENKEFIDIIALQQMKTNAVLINTARGGLIKEQDLKYALENKIIAGAGLDVLSTEPPEKSNPLLNLENCIITPHNAWASYESRKRCMAILIDNVRAFVEGEAQNLV